MGVSVPNPTPPISDLFPNLCPLVYHPGVLAWDDLVIALQEEVLQPVHVQQHHAQFSLELALA